MYKFINYIKKLPYLQFYLIKTWHESKFNFKNVAIKNHKKKT